MVRALRSTHRPCHQPNLSRLMCHALLHCSTVQWGIRDRLLNARPWSWDQPCLPPQYTATIAVQVKSVYVQFYLSGMLRAEPMLCYAHASRQCCRNRKYLTRASRGNHAFMVSEPNCNYATLWLTLVPVDSTSCKCPR